MAMAMVMTITAWAGGSPNGGNYPIAGSVIGCGGAGGAGGGGRSAVHQLEEERLQQPRLVGDGVPARVERLQLQRRLHHRLHIAPVHLGAGEEGEALLEDAVPHHHHLAGHRLEHGEEAALRVEPRVRAQLLGKGLQALHHPADAELVVALAAVQRPDHQVDDAQVEDLLLLSGVGHRPQQRLLLLLLDLPHQLLGVLILPRHDVADAEVGEDDGADVEDAVVAAPHQLLVEAGRLLELVLLVVELENVGDVELPQVEVVAELRRLAEDLLDVGVRLQLPVDLRLRHQHGNVEGQCLLVGGRQPLQRLSLPTGHRGGVVRRWRAARRGGGGGGRGLWLNRTIASSRASIRDRLQLRPRLGDLLRLPPQGVSVAGGQLVEALVGLLGRRLLGDQRVEELVEVGRQVAVGVGGVLRHQVGRQLEVVVLAVEQQQIGEGLRGKVRRPIGRALGSLVRPRPLADEKLQLLKALHRVAVHREEGNVVQRHRVELLLRPGRHVRQRLPRRLQVLQLVLDGRPQVKGLHQRRLVQRLGVADAAHLDAALGVGAHRQLRVLLDALFDDLADVGGRLAVPPQLVVADGEVVEQVRFAVFVVGAAVGEAIYTSAASTAAAAAAPFQLNVGGASNARRRSSALIEIQRLHLKAAVELLNCLLVALLLVEEAAQIRLPVHQVHPTAVAAAACLAIGGHLLQQGAGRQRGLLLLGVLDCRLQLDQLRGGKVVVVVRLAALFECR
ncbi:hypothetical protein TYRP_002929 [Tyrophagus putrescentiae]|nr:hypothetical protein TYRP_002929 [Tyrophagus putrescentiae]